MSVRASGQEHLPRLAASLGFDEEYVPDGSVVRVALNTVSRLEIPNTSGTIPTPTRQQASLGVRVQATYVAMMPN